MVTTTELKTINDWADFWRYNIGVNVIPADTQHKGTNIRWFEWQDKPIPEELYSEWKSIGAFNKGIAIILGKIWHNKQKSGLYVNGIDADNLKAIEEICIRDNKTISLAQLAQWTLVEQHLDDSTRMHVLVYSHQPFAKKSSQNSHLGSKIDSNEIPAIEVKGLGSHGILFVTPSIHKNGCPYQIIGTCEPVIADDFEQHINSICRKYSIPYLDGNENGKGLVPIQDLFQSDFKIVEGNNRHEALMRVMESLILRNLGILTLEQIKPLTQEWNVKHCKPPLDNKQFEKQWRSAIKFVGLKARLTEDNTTKQENNNKDKEEDQLARIKLTRDQIDFVFHTIIKEAQYDGLSIKQIFYGYNSAFTKLPIPHVVNSKTVVQVNHIF